MHSTKRRIAVLSEIFPPKTGGSGRWLFEVYRRFPPNVVTFFAGLHEDAREFDRAESSEIERLDIRLQDWGTIRPRSCLKFLRLARTVSQLMRKKSAGCLHAARVLPEGWVAYILKVTRRIPYVVFVHGEDICSASWSREHSWMVRRVLRNADIVVANSQNTASLLRENWNTESELLYPGVDCDFFTPAPRDANVRQRLGWADRHVVLTVGRLQERKGHDMLIRAISQIRREIPDILYAICGKGEQRTLLDELVRTLKLEDHVLFMDEVDDSILLSAYQQCDLFALPNREIDRDIEGFGMVLIEAQACGRPVLAGNSGGTKETMNVDVTGLIEDCTSVDNIARTLIALLTDDKRKNEMGKLARQHVENKFDWSIVSKQAETLFNSLS